MATPKTIPWTMDAHTAAKHDLLRRYLEAWTPILLSRFPRATYAEGFAGPGVYDKGEPGSPIIALQVALTRRDILDSGKHLSMILVDENKRCIESLDRQIAATLQAHGQPRPLGLHITTETGTCGQALLKQLDASNAFGEPILAILDSFGGPDVPYDVIEAMARNRSSEVLITFGPTFLTRFGEVDQHRDSGDAAFGGTHWQLAAQHPAAAKKAFLVTAYRQSLRQAGFKHSLTFEMIDEGGHPLFLIFGTNSPTGLAKMKNAMWHVDPHSGIRYRDPRDQSQTLLDLALQPDKTLLARMLLDRVGTGEATIEDLRDYTLLETVYRPEHVTSTVTGLVQRNALMIVKPEGRVTRTTTVRRGSLAPHTSLKDRGGLPPGESTLF